MVTAVIKVDDLFLFRKEASFFFLFSFFPTGCIDESLECLESENALPLSDLHPHYLVHHNYSTPLSFLKATETDHCQVCNECSFLTASPSEWSRVSENQHQSQVTTISNFEHLNGASRNLHHGRKYIFRNNFNQSWQPFLCILGRP